MEEVIQMAPVVEVKKVKVPAPRDCKTCDFCMIKKELAKLNQNITCPLKSKAKRALESGLEAVDKVIKVGEEVETVLEETKQLITPIEQYLSKE
jgi:hypothetical protein